MGTTRIIWAVMIIALLQAVSGTGANAQDRLDGRKSNNPVESIMYSVDRGQREQVCIAFGVDLIPKVSALTGDKPRVVVDIHGVAVWDGGEKQEVGGNFIHSIRSHLHTKKQMLRVVLDLDPEEDYSVSQIYFEKEKLFCLSIGHSGK